MSIRFPRENGMFRFPETPIPVDEEMAELSLLLPGWQAAALEQSARARGMTVGQVLRGLVRDFLAQERGMTVLDAHWG
jgi:hypothetical protein